MTDGHRNEPRIYPVGKNLFAIVEPLIYEWNAEGFDQKLIIPASIQDPFIFDGASIPVFATFLTWLIPGVETIYPMGLHIYATAFHDFLFAYQGRIPKGTHVKFSCGVWVDARHRWTFTESNRLFGRMLKEDGVEKTERELMKAGVQSLVGKWCWHVRPRDERLCSIMKTHKMRPLEDY